MNKFAFTMKAEGCDEENPTGYVKDPDDSGGETIAGISRRYHSDWEGWKLVDEIKRATVSPFDLRRALDTTEIHTAINNFYEHWWQKYKCNKIYSVSPALAIAVFSTTFMTFQAFSLLQKSVNFLVKKHKKIQANISYYTNILEKDGTVKVDNDMGNQTLTGIHLIVGSGFEESLVNVFLYKRVHYQMDLRNKRKYYRGWANRTAELGFYLYSNDLL